MRSVRTGRGVIREIRRIGNSFWECMPQTVHAKGAFVMSSDLEWMLDVGDEGEEKSLKVRKGEDGDKIRNVSDRIEG